MIDKNILDKIQFAGAVDQVEDFNQAILIEFLILEDYVGN